MSENNIKEFKEKTSNYDVLEYIDNLEKENQQLKQLNKVVYVDKSKKILDGLEMWLEYRFTPNHMLKVDEIQNKIKKLKENSNND